jgi:hypothetical protein
MRIAKGHADRARSGTGHGAAVQDCVVVLKGRCPIEERRALRVGDPFPVEGIMLPRVVDNRSEMTGREWSVLESLDHSETVYAVVPACKRSGPAETGPRVVWTLQAAYKSRVPATVSTHRSIESSGSRGLRLPCRWQLPGSRQSSVSSRGFPGTQHGLPTRSYRSHPGRSHRTE